MEDNTEKRNSRYGDGFQEIGHCGGKFTVHVESSRDGRRSIQVGIRHSKPTPAAWFAIYALPQGIPVGTIQLGGIGQSRNPAPAPSSFSIFIGSDTLSMFGRECPQCGGYWRSRSAPSKWSTTCPYCGLKAEAHHFITEGQLRYVEHCCRMMNEAINSSKDGDFVIDLDQVADAVLKDKTRPKFYYTEAKQQNQFVCSSCGDINDILGRYGYCSCCGSHNALQELKKDLSAIRNEIMRGGSCSSCAKDAISGFDSFARQLAKQLTGRIPMTPKRKDFWEKKLFHNLKPCVDQLQTAFDIDLFKDIPQADRDFAIRMFHRRHIYEHNGGEVDDRYIKESGDSSVRLKQVIQESKESALRITEILEKLGDNYNSGFHAIFPPESSPVEYERNRLSNKHHK